MASNPRCEINPLLRTLASRNKQDALNAMAPKVQGVLHLEFIDLLLSAGRLALFVSESEVLWLPKVGQALLAKQPGAKNAS